MRNRRPIGRAVIHRASRRICKTACLQSPARSQLRRSGGVTHMVKSNGVWPILLVVLLLLAAIAFKSLLIQPRMVTGSEFDTGRAIARLERILGDQRPHPVDTPANDAVRERLRAELSAMGIKSTVVESTDCSGFPKSRAVSCAHSPQRHRHHPRRSSAKSAAAQCPLRQHPDRPRRGRRRHRGGGNAGGR